ncbi:MAG: acyl-CoA dehydrogenase [Acidobacteria bacterium]|nr:MAG: acyl-CoA dehydrogenase [Acidobacteriota bacterium]
MPDAAKPLTSLTDEQQMLISEVRRFNEEMVRPRIETMDREAKLDPDVLRHLFELGLMGIDIPDDLGGSGMTFTDAILVIMELARVDPSVSVVCDVQNTLVNNAIQRWGTDEQKKRFLPRLASDTVGAYCLSEAESGSDAFALRTRAYREGDGWRLSGNKLWITNGYEAGIYLVFANADPEKGYRGITCFVVERDMEGFSVGKKEDKLGIRASSTVEIVLDDVRVGDDRVLGEVGKGYKVAIETLNEGRIGIGAQMVGLAQGAMEHALGWAKERKQFGRPIADFQAVQFALARMDAEIEAARLTVLNAARVKESGQTFAREAAIAKWFAAEVAERVTSMAVELFGGYGFTKDYPVEKLYRDAKIGKIYEGTHFMQLQTIAKLLLAG